MVVGRKESNRTISDTLNTDDTVKKAWEIAVTNRAPSKRMLFHSDQGIQYASTSFRRLLKRHKVTQSMSRKGNCWDNAVAESFFRILKYEFTNHMSF